MFKFIKDTMSVLNKVLPDNKAKLRNKIDALERKRDRLLQERSTVRNINQLQHIIAELRILKKRLHNQ